MIEDPRTLLTPDEQYRFMRTLATIIGPHIRQFHHAFSDYAMALLPTVRLEQCLEKLGARVFARRLLGTTLHIYHDSPEWLGLCYGTALKSDEARDVIVDYLMMAPGEDRAFISKVLDQIKEEMTTQLAAHLTHTPFSLQDRQSTYAFFHPLYHDALHQIAALNNAVAHRRLLF